MSICVTSSVCVPLFLPLWASACLWFCVFMALYVFVTVCICLSECLCVRVSVSVPVYFVLLCLCVSFGLCVSVYVPPTPAPDSLLSNSHPTDTPLPLHYTSLLISHLSESPPVIPPDNPTPQFPTIQIPTPAKLPHCQIPRLARFPHIPTILISPEEILPLHVSAAHSFSTRQISNPRQIFLLPHKLPLRFLIPHNLLLPLNFSNGHFL